MAVVRDLCGGDRHRQRGNSLTVSGGYAAVNTALSTLSETDPTTGSDPITVTATDQFGFTAGAKTIGVTVAGLPVVNAPGSLIVATGIARTVGGVSVSEANAVGSEGLTVVVSDSHGLISIGSAFGATLQNNGTTSETISGTFTQVNNALTTLTDTNSIATTDTISIAATDAFGNVATTPGSIAVTVNGLPVITAPSTTIAVGLGKSTAINGVSISETGSPAGDTFNVTLADTNGLLTLGTITGLAITGQGTASVNLTGSLANINLALGRSATPTIRSGADSIVINASDTTLGASAIQKSVSINDDNGPVITIPATGATIGVGKAGAISGVTLSESGSGTNETFTFRSRTRMDCYRPRALEAPGCRARAPRRWRFLGTLTQIAAALGTLTDFDATTPNDTITLNSVDQFGSSSATQTLAVTVNSLPAISAPASDVVGVGQTETFLGVGVTENGNTTGESLSVVVSDATGVLTGSTASGGAIANNGTHSITVSGTFAQVDAILAALTLNEAGGTSDIVSLTAADGFANSATPASVSIIVNGAPKLTAPSAVAVGVGKTATASGVSLAETGNTAGETFTITASDTNGVLSASNAGGASVSAAATALTISGSLEPGKRRACHACRQRRCRRPRHDQPESYGQSRQQRYSRDFSCSRQRTFARCADERGRRDRQVQFGGRCISERGRRRDGRDFHGDAIRRSWAAIGDGRGRRERDGLGQ